MKIWMLGFFLTWVMSAQIIGKEDSMTFTLVSSSFEQGQMIPAQYTCDSKNISPKLSWSNPPAKTKSFVLICTDPDAHPLWTHWVVYNIPANVDELPEDLSKDEKLPDGTLQGLNDFRRAGYGGPCPPSGTHRYFFKLYALDITLDLSPKETRQQIENAMKGHILAQTELMGTYQRNQ